MKRIIALLVASMFVFSSALAYDFSAMDDLGIESLLTVLEYFEPMTKEEMLQFTNELRAEKEKRDAAHKTSVKGSIIYENDDMRIILKDHFLVNDSVYGPVSVVKLEWLNKKQEATTRTRVFKIEQYQNGVELSSAYISEYDTELLTSIRGGATLVFYSLGIVRNTSTDIELVFDMASDYYNEFDDISITIPVK